VVIVVTYCHPVDNLNDGMLIAISMQVSSVSDQFLFVRKSVVKQNANGHDEIRHYFDTVKSFRVADHYPIAALERLNPRQIHVAFVSELLSDVQQAVVAHHIVELVDVDP
jgi:hypothetical protein